MNHPTENMLLFFGFMLNCIFNQVNDVVEFFSAVGQELSKIGARVIRVSTISDDKNE
jgi:hypothetical protein